MFQAMHHLGIPTTRGASNQIQENVSLILIFIHVCFILCAAGTCITSDDYIIRDIHYNGNPIQERATVISRIAPTFIR